MHGLPFAFNFNDILGASNGPANGAGGQQPAVPQCQSGVATDSGEAPVRATHITKEVHHVQYGNRRL